MNDEEFRHKDSVSTDSVAPFADLLKVNKAFIGHQPFSPEMHVRLVSENVQDKRADNLSHLVSFEIVND